MRLQRLRLAGFKSFVDPTEFRVEPGLTGVVGPNGCGKSNLLESLRWAMGATSAKAMRGAQMEDVIFNGGGGRPARSWAEVTLTLDNADGRAPAAFNADPVLQVSRRIDRGGGSTYRVNSREVRARDVQLLFADASTGANSPALVRQGQISELIAARPENRRRILEEAGGVSGLHGRRHEAELRLKAAEANLLRLDDVVAELEGAAARLRREARQAERYRRLAAEIRQLHAAVLRMRWAEADAAASAARSDLAERSVSVERSVREAATWSVVAADAAAALPALRDEQLTAAAVHQRLTLERDRLQREELQARAEADRLQADAVRLQADRAREERIAEDGRLQLDRLASALARAEAELAQAPERLPALRAAAAAAEVARADADQAVEQLMVETAAANARRVAQVQRQADLTARAARARQALDAALMEREALAAEQPPSTSDPRSTLQAAQAALEAAREARRVAEADRDAALADEVRLRDAARKAEDALGRLRTEARGLAELLTSERRGGFAPVLDSVSVEPGYEAALAAALGDDLQAALDPAAASHWSGADVVPIDWPEGVEPLAGRVRAPAALAARLARIGVRHGAADRDLTIALPVGARLVSTRGDLWRWDGFTARAEAPGPSAVRLAQKARLARLEEQIDDLTPAAAAAVAEHQAAARAAGSAAEALTAATRSIPAQERGVAEAAGAVEAFQRATAVRDARLQALEQLIDRLTVEAAEADAALSTSPAIGPGAETTTALELQGLREAAAAAREAAGSARSTLDVETREAQARSRRLDGLRREREDWSRRHAEASRRVAALHAEHLRTLAAIDASREAPGLAVQQGLRLAEAHAAAERRRAAADDAWATAEAARGEADRRLREAEAAASAAREARALAQARDEAAEGRLAEAVQRIRDVAGVEPAALAEALTMGAVAVPPDADGLETHLAALERQRDAFGGVNLLAEEEAASVGERLNGLLAERADLTGAIARLREGVVSLNSEGRERLLAAFGVIQAHFKTLFQTLFDGGQAELRLVESDDPLEAGLEIYACPPGKRLASMSLLSGGEQALTAVALIFAVFLANPAPICVLDEVDAPLDDANVERLCRLLEEMTRRTATPFLVITHNAVTMSRMDRLYGVTMPSRGVSQLVSVDLRRAELMAAE